MLPELSRREFLDDRFDYRPGEHVSLIWPTQGGKTHLGYQLLDVAMRQNPDLTVMAGMPKSRSPATHRWAEGLSLQETPTWPPRRKLFRDKPRGYVLWPPHRLDVSAAERRALVATQLRRGLNDQFVKGRSITFLDDIHVAAVLMGLNPECEEFWTAGAEGDAGLWTANQKPSGTMGGGSVSSFAYNAPKHLFLGKDTDDRNVKRFSEIGGVDPKLVAETVKNLRLYPIDRETITEVLYIDKRGPYMCLIGP